MICKRTMRFAYETIHGIAVPAVTAAQMREVDRVAAEEDGPNLFQMTENAGRNLAATALRYLGETWMESRILVLAGSGCNGAGGICAARHLANRGASITVCMPHKAKLSEITAWQHRVYRATGSPTISCRELQGDDFDLILDALVGYGLEAPPRGAERDAIAWANDSESPIISLDVPSGVEATFGTHPGEFIHAKETVTLALPKTGLFPDLTGTLLLADVGIPAGVYEKLEISYTPPFGADYVVPLRALPTA